MADPTSSATKEPDSPVTAVAKSSTAGSLRLFSCGTVARHDGVADQLVGGGGAPHVGWPRARLYRCHGPTLPTVEDFACENASGVDRWALLVGRTRGASDAAGAGRVAGGSVARSAASQEGLRMRWV